MIQLQRDRGHAVPRPKSVGGHMPSLERQKKSKISWPALAQGLRWWDDLDRPLSMRMPFGPDSAPTTPNAAHQTTLHVCLSRVDPTRPSDSIEPSMDRPTTPTPPSESPLNGPDDEAGAGSAAARGRRVHIYSTFLPQPLPWTGSTQSHSARSCRPAVRTPSGSVEGVSSGRATHILSLHTIS